MADNVIMLRPTDEVLEAAWEAYADAARAAAALAVDRNSLAADRVESSFKAVRLHAEFTRLFKRACA